MRGHRAGQMTSLKNKVPKSLDWIFTSIVFIYIAETNKKYMKEVNQLNTSPGINPECFYLIIRTCLARKKRRRNSR